MKKTDLNVLKRLLNEEGIKGKKRLEQFIWVNTVPSKYNVGDKVKVTDRRTTINGSRVIDWIGTVEKVRTVMNELRYTYDIKVKYITKDNIIKETKVCVNECDIKKTRAKKDINRPINTKDEQSTDIHIRW